MGLRIGIDTGGTYTDAVMIDERGGLVASAKSFTTHHDLIRGIDGALAGLSRSRFRDVTLVGLSTTLATNAIVEGRSGRAAAIFIGFGAEILGRSGLREALADDPHIFIGGGHGPSGFEARPLDREALGAFLGTIGKDVGGVAVISAFAVRNPAHEREAADMVTESTGLPVTMSHELTARLDGPRRALTTLFNARLIGRIAGLLDAVAASLAGYEIVAPLMIVRGDGALFSATSARMRPIETILSGPAASCVGAAHMTGLDHAFVSDIGGTTTDIGIIEQGRPRRSAQGAIIGRHCTMVEAIAVETVGLGGDSFIRSDDGRLVIGPERALPLGRLASDHPEIIERLEAQAERPEARPHDGVFAIRHMVPKDIPRLTKSQARLLDLLEYGPRPLEELIDRERLGMAFDTLLGRGWVLRSAFTPSDAAHVTGALSLFDGRASLLGATLLRRSRTRTRNVDVEGIEAFAEAVIGRFNQLSAAAVATTALARSGLDDRHLRSSDGRALVEASVASHGAASGAGTSISRLQVRLDAPLVAVGAPASLFYRDIAERMAAPLRLPERFDVCNAIGAVVGLVAATAEVRIEVEDDRVRLLLDAGPKPVATFAEALDLARAAAEGTARAKVEADGAEDVSVRLSTAINDYVDVTGERKILDAVITAEAIGRPPFMHA